MLQPSAGVAPEGVEAGPKLGGTGLREAPKGGLDRAHLRSFGVVMVGAASRRGDPGQGLFELFAVEQPLPGRVFVKRSERDRERVAREDRPVVRRPIDARRYALRAQLQPGEPETVGELAETPRTVRIGRPAARILAPVAREARVVHREDQVVDAERAPGLVCDLAQRSAGPSVHESFRLRTFDLIALHGSACGSTPFHLPPEVPFASPLECTSAHALAAAGRGSGSIGAQAGPRRSRDAAGR